MQMRAVIERKNVYAEPLENRRLFSSWGTVDQFQFAPTGEGCSPSAIASDAAGNVFVGGIAADANGVYHDVVRMKPAGSSTWSTLSDQTNVPSFSKLAVAPNGDLYAAEGQTLLRMKRSAGESSFSVILQQGSSGINDVSVDSSGNVFVASTGVVTKGSTRTSHWILSKQTAGVGAFVTVDDYLYSKSDASAKAITFVTNGPAAGIYVTGYGGFGGLTNSRELVRKSSDGGASWKLVDDNRFDADGGAFGETIIADSTGNVYVGGRGYDYDIVKRTPTLVSKDVFVRKSANGGTSWTTDYIEAMPSPAVMDMAAAPSGAIYVVGATSGFVTPVPTGFVRTNASGQWAVEENFQADPGTITETNGVTVDPNGTVFTSNWSEDSAGTYQWYTRSNSVAAASTAFSTMQIAAPSSSIVSQIDLLA
jgi:hypothetical protein